MNSAPASSPSHPTSSQPSLVWQQKSAGPRVSDSSAATCSSTNRFLCTVYFGTRRYGRFMVLACQTRPELRFGHGQQWKATVCSICWELTLTLSVGSFSRSTVCLKSTIKLCTHTIYLNAPENQSQSSGAITSP